MTRWPELDDAAVHVWTASLLAPGASMARFSAVLSPDERERQARLVAGRVRERFTVARWTLRTLLGRYLGVDPAQIVFTYGSRGKPSVTGSRLTFNLAHSDELAAYAFTHDTEIGIDIEVVREVPEMEGIAAQFFSRQEAEALRSLPARERLRAFYAVWTRKEAYVKAVGEGLHTPLDSFQVTLADAEHPRLTVPDGSSSGATHWNLHHLEPMPGCIGALAYQGTRRKNIQIRPFSAVE